MKGLPTKVEKGKGSLIRDVSLAAETIALVIPDSDIEEASMISLHTSATTALYATTSVSLDSFKFCFCFELR